jgi:hypothetical protein
MMPLGGRTRGADKLDLLQLAAAGLTQFGAGSWEIMRAISGPDVGHYRPLERYLWRADTSSQPWMSGSTRFRQRLFK